MEIFILIINIVGICLYFLHNIHIYQLNYYKKIVQWKWLLNNILLVIINTILPTLGILFFMKENIPLALIIGILIIIFNYPKPAKKKLVFTNRVIRMIIEYVIIVTLVSLLGNNLSNSIIILQVIFILTPVLLILIDISQNPLNKYINNGFINDAKRILKEKENLTIIGVTGSYGKTSMKFFLTEFLSTKYDVLMTPGNLNTTLGVVRTIRENLKSNHEIFVCEMGATKLNDIKEICDIVKPKYGIITSIGPQHLESFKSIDNVVKTKFELADSLPEDGVLFLNYDNEYIKNKKDSHKIISYGIENTKTNLHATNIKGSKDGLSFTVDKVKFTTKLIGNHNVLNIVGALAVCKQLGIEPEHLVEKVRKLEPVPHRLELKNQGNRIIIDDAYNSNPVGSKYALDTLNYFSGIKVLITPGMVELGSSEDQYNKEFGEYAAKICDYVLLVNENQTKMIEKGLLEKGFPKDKVLTFKTFNLAYEYLLEIEKNGKLVVLIENDLPDQY